MEINVFMDTKYGFVHFVARIKRGRGAHFYPFNQVIPPVYSIIKVELIDGI